MQSDSWHFGAQTDLFQNSCTFLTRGRLNSGHKVKSGQESDCAGGHEGCCFFFYILGGLVAVDRGQRSSPERKCTKKQFHVPK